MKPQPVSSAPAPQAPRVSIMSLFRISGENGEPEQHPRGR